MALTGNRALNLPATVRDRAASVFVRSAGGVRVPYPQIMHGLYVSGSGTLVRAMLADGLVDELHLFVYPLTLGEGQKLFEGTPASKFTLAHSEVYDNGVLYLRYHPAA